MKTASIFLMVALVAFISGGLKAQTATFTDFTTTDGLPDDFVSGGVTVDQNNVKWFGTASGVASFDDATWTIYTTTDGLIDNYINCITVDYSNHVWIGTDNGVSMFDGTTWTSYTMTDGLVDNAVYAIASAPDGSMWFGTYAGASKLNSGTWTSFVASTITPTSTTSDSLPSNSINSIAIDSLGNVWFGTMFGGAAKYDGSAFTLFTTSTNLPDDNVFAIAVDENNNKLIGTWYGIAVFDNNDQYVETYTYAATNLFNDFVRDITFDNDSRIWVGMFADYNQEGGISVFDGQNWSSYSVSDGLINAQVKKVAVDQNNYVWVATGSGVSKIEFHVGVNDNKLDNSNFSFYPNPAKGYVTINTDSNSPLSVSIIDAKGTNVITQEIKDGQSIDITSLSTGLYLIKATENNSVSVDRLMVE